MSVPPKSEISSTWVLVGRMGGSSVWVGLGPGTALSDSVFSIVCPRGAEEADDTVDALWLRFRAIHYKQCRAWRGLRVHFFAVGPSAEGMGLESLLLEGGWHDSLTFWGGNGQLLSYALAVVHYLEAWFHQRMPTKL